MDTTTSERLAEAFEIQVLDILSKRHLPRSLIVVVQFAQFFWIHSKFTPHLDLFVGDRIFTYAILKTMAILNLVDHIELL